MFAANLAGNILVLLVVSALAYGSTSPCLADNEPLPGGINRPVRDKWALVVGIGTFQNPNIPKLRFAAKDARDFRNYLVTEANFAVDHVRLLLDEKATQRRVMSELGNKFLARVAKPDDMVVIYFSTHGSPAQLDVRGKNFVVAYDSDPDDLFTTGIEMDRIVEAIKSRLLSDRILLVLDACHSGAINSGAKGLRRGANFDAAELSQGSGQMVICSSAPDEQSWESKRYENGIFTRKLIESMRLQGSRTTLGKAFPYVVDSVASEAQEDYGARQKPDLKSRWSGSELVLAIRPALPGPLPQSVREILEPDSTAAAAQQRPQRSAAKTSVALPAGSDMETGIKLYKNGDYGSAVSFLTSACRGRQAGSADCHYYLALSLSRLNRVDEAVREFRESYKLNSKGPAAAYCLNYIREHEAARPAPQAQPAGTARQPAASPAKMEAARPGSAMGAAELTALARDAARIKSSLPRLDAHRPEPPYLADVLNWTLSERSNYQGVAAQRVEAARLRLDEAQSVFKRAESLAYSLLPAQKSYGESEADFQSRLAAARSHYDELLSAYKNEVEARSKALAEESSIHSACVAATSQLRH